MYPTGVIELTAIKANEVLSIETIVPTEFAHPPTMKRMEFPCSRMLYFVVFEVEPSDAAERVVSI